MTGVTNISTGVQATSSLKELTVGLDVSDTYSSFCVLDDSGEILEEGRVRTTRAALTQRFESANSFRVILEVGTHSPWISRLLQDLGHEVVIANARKVRLIAEDTRKNDAPTLRRWLGSEESTRGSSAPSPIA